MNRTVLNIIIDLLATLSFLGMIATGYLLRFPLPPGSNKSHVLWGLTRHEWGDIHFWISVGLLLIMLVHLALHWNWIVTVIGKRCGLVKSAHPSLFRAAVWAIVGFVALCIGFAWLVDQNVKVSEYPGKGQHAGWGRRFGSRGIGRTKIESEAQPVSQAQNKPLAWKDVYPIFQRNCLACHGPQRQSAEFRVDHLPDFFKPEAPWVVAGLPEQSPLLAIISGKRADMAMADVHRLPDTEVDLIKSWIEQGARQ